MNNNSNTPNNSQQILDESSCSFRPLGKTIQDCFNKCQEANTEECTDYCNNICSNCDTDDCLWISSLKPDKYLEKYNELTNDIIEYQNKQQKQWNSTDDKKTSAQIELSKKISDLKTRRNILWKYLLNEYNLNTQLSEANYQVLRSNNKNIKMQKKNIEKNNESIDSITNLTNTKKRIMEINLNKYSKLKLQIKLLKIYALLLFFGFIFYLLLVKGIIPKKIALILYGIYVVTISILLLWYFYKKGKKRDDLLYTEMNFGKPTSKEVGTNKLLSDMSDKDKQKCLALSDVIEQDKFDPDDVDIGNINRYINDSQQCKLIKSKTKFNDIYNDSPNNNPNK